MSNSPINQSLVLYNHVRSGFVRQGTTLTAYCRRMGVAPANARSALIGAWNGPKAIQLRAELIKASGIDVLDQPA